MQNLLSDEPTKRSIFSDSTKARTVEWKYITDVNARPFLKTIAGEIDSCISNFEIRTLNVNIFLDNCRGTLTTFNEANYHNPNGYSIRSNNDIVMYHNSIQTVGLETQKIVMLQILFGMNILTNQPFLNGLNTSAVNILKLCLGYIILNNQIYIL